MIYRIFHRNISENYHLKWIGLIQITLLQLLVGKRFVECLLRFARLKVRRGIFLEDRQDGRQEGGHVG